MKPIRVIGTTALFLLLGITAPTYAQQEQQSEKPQQDQNKQQQQQDQKKQQQGQNRQQPQQDQKKQQQGQNRQQPQQQQQRAQQQQDQNKQQQQRAQQQQAQNNQQPQRLSQQVQQQRINQQQQRVTQYQQNLGQQERLAQQQTGQLQQQKRMAQSRFEQDYAVRLQQQQVTLQNDRNHDYNRDPYFYTASSYRYNRGGSYYETNQYGADLLRQAVNYGYQEGFRSGQADQQDRWGSNYQGSYAYQDANYGYGGYYVDQGEYNYYFREGFRRGYEDGFNSRYQYGSVSNGSYSILGAVMSQILDLQSLR